ncbi:RNA binding protein [Leishmania tarentolae]|uniref:RNA binding protein n=1 Tax=Leishmania tarentolae TaxID=5689 RepID=A0A640KE10_LEITA|nr:RNA binding protein [Leishmania tarentolae]
MNTMSPFYGRTYPTHTTPLMWEVTQTLQSSLVDQSADIRRSLDLAMSLHEVLERNREIYNNIIAERNEAYSRLRDADAKLQQVEHVVRRYAEVKDPVVASDGYTYERTELSRYLSECKKSNSKAYSQQTKEELTDVMVDNVSLRRLAELLKGVHSVEVPRLSSRPLLAGGVVDVNGPRSHWAEDGPSMSGAEHTEMGPGPVGHAGGAGGRGGNGMALGLAHAGLRYDRSGGAKYGKPSNGNEGKGGLHPCLRVYGYCNFEDDCTFANYPYEACLNHIKGKCRFGTTCKELHVDPRDPVYQNVRSFANHHHQGGNGANTNHAHNNATAGANNNQTADAGAEASRQSGSKMPESVAEREAETAAATKNGQSMETGEPTAAATADAPKATDE